MNEVLDLARGELVTIRSEEQILATLDGKGELDGLPLMPEMLRFCGQQLRVAGRADKTCDTISGEIRSRRMRHAVHLVDSRCDGSAHGGCEADCLIFWKEAWLERAEAPRVHPLWRFVADRASSSLENDGSRGCRREEVDANTLCREQTAGGEIAYRCQTTQLLEATEPLSPRAPRQYLRDWLSGNIPASYLLKIGILRLSLKLVKLGRGFKLKVKVYDVIARAFGEPIWPFYPGRLTGRTPAEQLDLVPGDLVTIKSHDEIRDTLNDQSNRGMAFAPEMVRYCGGTYLVRARVEKILDERTGKMLKMKNDCIILEDVVCRSECSTSRLFCPRAIYPYWREIWLRRASPAEKSD